MMIKGDQLRLERIPSPTPSPPPSPLLRAIRVCADFESPPKMWVCAGHERGEAGSEAGSEAEADCEDDLADSEAGEGDGEDSVEGDASGDESGEEGASGKEGAHKRADGARKVKARKGSGFVEHEAGHSLGSDGESATEDGTCVVECWGVRVSNVGCPQARLKK